MRHSRNCRGTGDKKVKYKVFNEILHECPVRLIDAEAVSIINIINMAEGELGMGCTPSKIMEETVFFMNVRAIIKDEYSRIEDSKTKGKR